MLVRRFSIRASAALSQTVQAMPAKTSGAEQRPRRCRRPGSATRESCARRCRPRCGRRCGRTGPCRRRRGRPSPSSRCPARRGAGRRNSAPSRRSGSPPRSTMSADGADGRGEADQRVGGPAQSRASASLAALHRGAARLSRADARPTTGLGHRQGEVGEGLRLFVGEVDDRVVAGSLQLTVDHLGGVAYPALLGALAQPAAGMLVDGGAASLRAGRRSAPGSSRRRTRCGPAARRRCRSSPPRRGGSRRPPRRR